MCCCDAGMASLRLMSAFSSGPFTCSKPKIQDRDLRFARGTRGEGEVRGARDEGRSEPATRNPELGTRNRMSNPHSAFHGKIEVGRKEHKETQKGRATSAGTGLNSTRATITLRGPNCLEPLHCHRPASLVVGKILGHIPWPFHRSNWAGLGRLSCSIWAMKSRADCRHTATRLRRQKLRYHRTVAPTAACCSAGQPVAAKAAGQSGKCRGGSGFAFSRFMVRSPRGH